mgnify:CR=1 FL=1
MCHKVRVSNRRLQQNLPVPGAGRMGCCPARRPSMKEKSQSAEKKHCTRNSVAECTSSDWRSKSGPMAPWKIGVARSKNGDDGSILPDQRFLAMAARHPLTP